MQAVHGCRLSVMEAFERISSFMLLALSSCSHLEIWTLLFCHLVSFSPCSDVWVSLVECSVLDFSGDPACTGLGLTVVHVLREALEEFTHFPCFGALELRGVWPSVSQNGEACTVDASGCSFSQRCSHLEVEHYFYERSTFDSLRQFSLLSVAFFGALDDEETFIIEGSCQLDRDAFVDIHTHPMSETTTTRTQVLSHSSVALVGE